MSFRKIYFLYLHFIVGDFTIFHVDFSKTTKKVSLIELNEMNNDNKVIILSLYHIFNQKEFGKLSELISSDYISTSGAKGVSAFQKSIIELSIAFTGAHWEIVEIIAEGNKVAVKQRFTGIHTGKFQNIEPSNKPVTAEGFALYEISNKKIISSSIQTDRFSFLNQLAVL